MTTNNICGIYRRWTGACVVLVYRLYQLYMTLQSKKWKMLCRKKMVGQGDFSATRSRLSPDGLARKALRKDPLSNSFSSITTFSIEKLTHAHIETVPVPNQLLCPYPVSGEWERSQFRTKIVDNTRTKNNTFREKGVHATINSEGKCPILITI